MRISAARELYGRAELRLRELLFGDSSYSGGRLRGEEPRQEARTQIRRMRKAFDEVHGEAERRAREPDPAESLLDEARRAAKDTEQRRSSSE